MPVTIVLKEILEKAIDREIFSQRLYADLKHRVKEQAAKDVFAMLVKQEQGHQQLLERYLKGELGDGALGRAAVIDYRIAEHLYQPEILPGMQLPDIFLLAANRERSSHDFYLELSFAHPPGEVKGFLKKLAGEELAHKRKMEFLFTEVAFPQTSGG